MSIADELWGELKNEKEQPFRRVYPPKLGVFQSNLHGAVLMSMETAVLICSDDEIRRNFELQVKLDIRELEKKHED